MVEMVQKPSGNWLGCRDRVISSGLHEGPDTQTDCKDFVAEGNLVCAYMALCSILEVGPLSEGLMADLAPSCPSGSSCGGWKLVSGAGEQPECSRGNQGTDCAAWQLSLFMLWRDRKAHKMISASNISLLSLSVFIAFGLLPCLMLMLAC